MLLNKLLKVCDIYNASRFNIPKENLEGAIKEVFASIKAKQGILTETENSIKNELRNKIGSEEDKSPARYELYRLYFKKEKLIYINLNKCLQRDNFIDGEVWIPKDTFPIVQDALKVLNQKNPSALSATFKDAPDNKQAPPTYIKTNEFTDPFQEIVNTYGIPRYGEINPALFTIVTFPFLFGVMFGDIGHGFLLFLFGNYLIFFKDDIIQSKSALRPALRARYLFVMMGFFAFYNGWMYNDFLSFPLGIFGTCYENVNSSNILFII